MLLSDASWRQAVRRRLLAWFRRAARPLPWRATRDPYRVWVSEVMLQQTQVATVQTYFERFVQQFPTVEHLARAPLDSVLRTWEGLGYYRRARQMHETAQRLAADYGGKFPRDLQQLQKLPGIGRYTAGAILSICFDLPHPILEANSARLLARLLNWGKPLVQSDSQRMLWSGAEQLVPRTRSGLFNQALMELGSLVCSPRTPDCTRCPLAGQCGAHAAGRQHELPVPARRTATELVREVSVVVRRGDEVLLRQYTDEQRWAGLWDFVRFARPECTESDLLAAIERQAVRECGVPLRLGSLLTVIRHGVTRYRITLDCYVARASGRATGKPSSSHWRWYAIEQLGQLPMSSTGRRISQLLCS